MALISGDAAGETAGGWPPLAVYIAQLNVAENETQLKAWP
jgi:hypothetical protein